MTNEVQEHIPERTGTVKSTVQRFFIVIGVVVTLGFMIGIYYAVIDENEKVAPKKLAPTPEKNQELDVNKLSRSFEDDVQDRIKNQKRDDENKAKRKRLADARQNQNEESEAEELGTSTNPASVNVEENVTAYDEFKTEAAKKVKTKDFAQLQMFMNKGTSFSKVEDDFAIEERRRALASRHSTLKLVPKSSASINTPSRDRATTRRNPTVKEKLALLDEKKIKAEQLKDEIINGTFNGGDIGALTSRLAELGMGSSDLPDYSEVTQTPRFSKVKSKEPRIVGAPKSQIERKKYVLNGVKLPVGTVIKAALDQTIMSDYANSPYKAHVTHDVYDAEYETILIPKGTAIDGRALTLTNINEPIQARMGLTTNWLILPNGNRIDLTKAAVLDNSGIGAIKDDVDYHFLAQFLGVAAYAVISSETENSTSSGFTGTTDIQGDIGQSMRQQFAPLASRYLGLKPTITLGVGTPITVYIEDEIILEPWGTIYDNLL